MEFKDADKLKVEFDSQCDMPAKSMDYRLIRVKDNGGNTKAFYSKEMSKFKYLIDVCLDFKFTKSSELIHSLLG